MSTSAATPAPGVGERIGVNSSDGGSSDASEIVTPCPSGDSSASRTPMKSSMPAPMSPPRSQIRPQHPIDSSLPDSPAPPVPIPDRAQSTAVTPSQPPRPMNPFSQPEATGVVLGLEQLERQQDEAERRRREQLTAPPVTPVQPRQHQSSTSTESNIRAAAVAVAPRPPSASPASSVAVRQYITEDDDHTAPTSTLGSATRSHTGDGSLGSGDDSSATAQKESTKFGRIIKNTRKRMSSNDFMRRRSSGDMENPASDDEDNKDDENALIYGHLQKLGRNGKWQTRWFETDGECLSYYKSSKRSKLLATLDLEKVGAIVVNEDDPKGCSFTMQVLGRPYYLRAESRAVCKDWVITLNRIKEAKLQQGNVKLANHQNKHILFRNPPDLLDRNVSTYTQGVVAVANRQRTRAVDESIMDNIEEMILKGESEQGDAAVVGAGYYETPDSDSLSQVVLARWQKRKSSMSKIASKVSRWARSLKKYNCADEDTGAHLDSRVHPPGHDNPKRTVPKNVERQNRAPHAKDGHVDPVQIIKQTPSDSASLPPVPVPSAIVAVTSETETRELS